MLGDAYAFHPPGNAYSRKKRLFSACPANSARRQTQIIIATGNWPSSRQVTCARYTSPRVCAQRRSCQILQATNGTCGRRYQIPQDPTAQCTPRPTRAGQRHRPSGGTFFCLLEPSFVGANSFVNEQAISRRLSIRAMRNWPPAAGCLASLSSVQPPVTEARAESGRLQAWCTAESD